ncbi:MAG: PfkB family carbohydrate kinase [Candidatus Omnitrophica bacterium]|nr:PfkB family carbohydrate kinase [Candidatus Omnitrophota bacterium]
MGKLLCVGSVAIDSVETPLGKRAECFGGSASFFSYAASFFAPVKLVACVGEDFPAEYRKILEKHNIDLSHLHVLKGKTFRWSGKYEGAMNEAKTLSVALNVFEEFDPVLDVDRDVDFIFLANIDPVLQTKVVERAVHQHVKLVAADTMNHWITEKRGELVKTLKGVNLLVLNDAEARQLTGEHNLMRAARKIEEFGPRYVVIKKGEHGSILLHDKDFFVLPAYPLEKVVDPTGAGDSFAGGMMGYLASTGKLDLATMKRAVAYGTVVASFTVEDFSLDRLRSITLKDINERFEKFKKILSL